MGLGLPQAKKGLGLGQAQMGLGLAWPDGSGPGPDPEARMGLGLIQAKMGLGLAQALVFTGGLAQAPNLALGQTLALFYCWPYCCQFAGQAKGTKVILKRSATQACS